MITEFKGAARNFCQDDVTRAAKRIGCEPAAIAAVVRVEANGSPFNEDGTPKTLYEAHIHGKETNYKYVSVLDPNGKPISARRWDKSLYGKSGSWQYTRMQVAGKCYPQEASLKAASWGAFQILGRNYASAGFKDVEAFVRAQMESAGRQLDSFVEFVINNKLDDELRNKEWASFAKGYNGPLYAQNQYDTKLKSAFKDLVKTWTSKYAACTAPDVHEEEPVTAKALTRDEVRVLQALLNVEVPVYRLTVDGWWGPKTEKAVRDFQRKEGIPESGQFDAETVERLTT